MKLDSLRTKNTPHIDYSFNRGFAEKYLEKIEFGTNVSAVFEKSAEPRYVMIERKKGKEKFYSPISLHQSSDLLVKKIEDLFNNFKDLGHIRFKGK